MEQLTLVITDGFAGLVSVIRNPNITDWANIIIAIVAVVSIAWNVYQWKQQRKIGLSLKVTDGNGDGIIENNSLSNFEVQLNTYVIDDGSFEKSASQAPVHTVSLLRALAKGAKETMSTLAMEVAKKEKNSLVLTQSLAPNESAQFHIHDLTAEQITVVFVLLEFIRNNRTSYILYRYAGREHAGLIPKELQRLCQPYNQWVRVFGFNKLSKKKVTRPNPG